MNKCTGCSEMMTSIYGGCASELTPSIMFKGKLVFCPCIVCLVKAMCTTSCDAFGEYLKIAFPVLEKDCEDKQ